MDSDKYEQLLEDVRKPSNRDPKFDGITDTIKAASELFVEGIRDSERQARINLKLQRWVCYLTVVLTALTIALTLIGLIQIGIFRLPVTTNSEDTKQDRAIEFRLLPDFQRSVE